MKIKSVHARKVSYRENYERDALALRSGSEHYMDVLVVTVETVDGAVGVGESLSYGGVDTVKIKIGGMSVREDLERVSAVREALGKQVNIACDANNVYDFNTAMRVGRELEKLGVIFFEEPIMHDYPDLSASLAQSLDIPIAGYETAYTQFECRDLIEKHAVDIVQADASWNGGITELLNIGSLANAHGLPLIPHYSAGGIGFG